VYVRGESVVNQAGFASMDWEGAGSVEGGMIFVRSAG